MVVNAVVTSPYLATCEIVRPFVFCLCPSRKINDQRVFFTVWTLQLISVDGPNIVAYFT